MKKLVFLILLTAMPLLSSAQGMSDQQVISFIASEAKAGTSQSQIVTKLMSRGVKIDQIRRLRNQYDSQINKAGKASAADGAVMMAAQRMAGNSDQAKGQDLTTAKRGTTGEVYADAAEEVQDVEHDVQATQGVAPDAQGKRVFGRDIFRQANPSFQPNENMPIPDTYVLGTGDQVVVDIYGASQNTLVHTISPEGTITVSGYGPIRLSGLTVAAAQAKLRNTIGSRYQSSNLRVSVGNTRTIQVNIMGEVRAPGTYHLSAFAYDYILNGRLAGNIMLQDNDVIQVEPYHSLVGITGNVKRPMFYEMRKDESVATLLKYAGGFTGDAHKKSVRLVRQTGERYQVYNVNEFDMADFKVEDGDAVTVDGMINRYENMVEIKGAVFRPGQFQLGTNINSVKTLVEAAEGLTEDAFTSHAVLHRLKADRSLEVLPIDVQGIMAGTVADVPLQNEDVLFIMTQEDLRQERTLTITGWVMSPGTYEYADNVTIEDLIVMAGGLRDQASLAKVDVSRRILDPHATAKTREIAKTFTFNYEGNFTLASKNMRLSDAINMAGGVTEDAYLKGARLVRTTNDEERLRRRLMLENIRNILTDQRDSVAWNKMDLDNNYPVAIDLEAALKNPGSDADVLLREGDRIFVPEYDPIVKISGDVMFPNTVFFENGKNIKHYVEQAGGYGDRAKKSKTFIVYQNGTIGLKKDGAKPEPGCEIIVPSKKHHDPIKWETILTGLSPLASIATLVVALTKL